MNKTFKKLSLSRTSIRVIRGSDLAGIAGGLKPTGPLSNTCTSEGTRPCDEPTMGCTNGCETYGRQC